MLPHDALYLLGVNAEVSRAICMKMDETLNQMLTDSVLMDSSGNPVRTGDNAVVRTAEATESLNEVISSAIQVSVNLRLSEDNLANPEPSREVTNAVDAFSERLINAALEVKYDAPSQEIQETARALIELKAAASVANTYEDVVKQGTQYMLQSQQAIAETSAEVRPAQQAALASLYFEEMSKMLDSVPKNTPTGADDLAKAVQEFAPASTREAVDTGVVLTKTMEELGNISRALENASKTTDLSEVAPTPILNVLKGTQQRLEDLDTPQAQGALEKVNSLSETITKQGLSMEVAAQAKELAQDVGKSLTELADKTVATYNANPDMAKNSEQLVSIANKAYEGYQSNLDALERKGELESLAGVLKAAHFISEHEKSNVLGDVDQALKNKLHDMGTADKTENLDFEVLLAKARDAGVTSDTLKSAMGELQSFAKETGTELKADPVATLEALVARETLLDQKPELGKQFDADTKQNLNQAQDGLEVNKSKEPASMENSSNNTTAVSQKDYSRER